MSTTERSLIEKLTPAEKRALKLKSEGHTRATAAAEMGVGRDHVKNLWQRARRKAKALGLPIFRELHARTIQTKRLSALDAA